MIYNTHSSKRDSCSSSFRDLAEYVEDAVRDLKPHRRDFDAIVVTGISGLSVGAPLALRLNKTLAVVRKTTEICHSRSSVEGARDLVGKRVLLVDDFKCTGKTLANMEYALEGAKVFDQSLGEHGDYGPLNCTLVGEYLYGDGALDIERKREEVK